MTSDALRSWGAGLGRRAHGRALAAAGVAAAAAPPGLRTASPALLASALSRDPVRWSPPPDDVARSDPRGPARQWDDALSRTGMDRPPGERLRLALEPPSGGGLHPSWLLELLAAAEPGSIALHQRTTVPAGGMRWGWPLDIGVAANAGADAIRGVLEREGHWWAEQFARIAPASARIAPVDVLFAAVAACDDAAALRREPLRAGAVLLLRSPDAPWTPDASELEAIRDHAHASAIGVADVPGDALREWLRALMYELSHDRPLDVALAYASERIHRTPATLLSDAAPLRATRLSAVVRRVRRRVDAVSPRAAERGMRPARPGPAQDRVRGLEGLAYDRESGGATFQSNESPAVERELDVAAAPRFLQAGITADPEPAPERFLPAVRVRRPFHLHARIGPADARWESGDAAVPEDDLDFAGGDERVAVILLAPDLLAAPLIRPLALPETGASDPCTFDLPAPRAAGEVRAELLLVHEQRLLQTAVVTVPVLEAGAAVPPGAGVQVRAGTVVRRSLHDLASRRPFDASILVGSATAGDAAVSVTRSERVDFIAPAGWQATAGHVRTVLNAATTDQWGTTGLRDRKVVELLIKLANIGEPLHQALRRAWGEQTVAATGLLQVVSAEKGAYFPLEFVYDRPAPLADAELCPHAEAALRDGACPDCPSQDDDRFVCPLGFWGLSRVIEHEDRTGPPAGSQFSILSEPTRARKHLSPPRGAIVGVSEKVDKVVADATATLAATVSAATGDAVTVTDWATWVARVEEKHPPLLVLVPHTAPHPFFTGVTALEIGTELLAASQIKPRHVCPTKEHHPVVILLGCDTAAGPSPLEGFPAQFHDDGAAIVLGTLTEVLGRHAAPLAGQVVEALTRRSGAGAAYFGELVREIRCDLLSRGLPLGLSLVAYGDADWVLPAT